MKRRLLAVAFVAALAVAQVLPASAVQISLNTSFCEGYGDTWVVYPSYAASHTIRTAGNCYSWARLHVFDPVTSSYVLVDSDYNPSGSAHASYSGAWLAAGTQHILRQNGTGEGITAWSWD